MLQVLTDVQPQANKLNFLSLLFGICKIRVTGNSAKSVQWLFIECLLYTGHCCQHWRYSERDKVPGFDEACIPTDETTIKKKKKSKLYFKQNRSNVIECLVGAILDYMVREERAYVVWRQLPSRGKALLWDTACHVSEQKG